jgi:hypothetical protein
VIHDAVATFVAELRAGGPMRSGAAKPKAAPAQSVDAAAAAAAAEAGVAAPGAAAAAAGQPQQQPAAGAAAEAGGKPAAAAATAAAPTSSGHSLALTEKFFAGAAELYECFTVPPRMMAYTQSPAEADPQPVSGWVWGIAGGMGGVNGVGWGGQVCFGLHGRQPNAPVNSQGHQPATLALPVCPTVPARRAATSRCLAAACRACSAGWSPTSASSWTGASGGQATGVAGVTALQQAGGGGGVVG